MKAFFWGFLVLNFSTDKKFVKLMFRIPICYLNLGDLCASIYKFQRYF